MMYCRYSVKKDGINNVNYPPRDIDDLKGSVIVQVHYITDSIAKWYKVSSKRF